jgi:hypothetical protein
MSTITVSCCHSELIALNVIYNLTDLDPQAYHNMHMSVIITAPLLSVKQEAQEVLQTDRRMH